MAFSIHRLTFDLRKSSLALLVVLPCILVIIASNKFGLPVTRPLNPLLSTGHGGLAYVIQHYNPFSALIRFPQDGGGRWGAARLMDDGRECGAGNASLAEIQRNGACAFNFTGGQLLFSTPDGAPLVMDRHHLTLSFRAKPTVTGTVLAASYVLLALLALARMPFARDAGIALGLVLAGVLVLVSPLSALALVAASLPWVAVVARQARWPGRDGERPFLAAAVAALRRPLPPAPALPGERRWELLAAVIALAFLAVWGPSGVQAADGFGALFAFSTDEPAYALALKDLVVRRVIPENVAGYGLFPLLLAGLLFSPLYIFKALCGYAVTDHDIVLAVRVSQLLFGAGAIFFTYKLTRLYARPWWAIMVAVWVATLPITAWAALTIHPDICQLFMVVLAAYFMARLHREHHYRLFLLSAVFAGLACGSKMVGGLFFFPAAPLAAWAVAGHLPPARRVAFAVLSMCWYAAVALWVFLAVNPQIVWHFDYFLATQVLAGGGLQFHQPNAGDLSAKLLPLLRPEFLGPLMMGAYVLAMLREAVAVVRTGRLGPGVPLAAVVLSFLLVVYPTYAFPGNDLAQIWSLRYLLQSAVFIPVAVAWAVSPWLERQPRWVTWVAVVAAVPTLGLVPVSSAEASRWQSYLQWHAETSARSESGRYQLGHWVAENVSPDARLYGEWYMNLPGWEFWWRTRRSDITVAPVIELGPASPRRVAELKPNWVFFSRPEDAEGLIAACEGNRTVRKFGNHDPVYILACFQP